MNIYVLDGKDMTGRDAAYRTIRDVMDFPDYFGKNLDALADCLGELNNGTAIVFVNTDLLRYYLNDYADRMLDTFRELSETAGFVFIEKR